MVEPSVVANLPANKLVHEKTCRKDMDRPIKVKSNRIEKFEYGFKK